MQRLFPPLTQLNVPNVVTSSALVFSATALTLLHAGYARVPVILFLVVLLLDRLDGMLARALGQDTAFGTQMDSLSDLLNFCAVPALVGWGLGMQAPWQVALLVAYVLAGMWRLAWFNLHGMKPGKPGKPRSARFAGVSTTHAAGLFLGVVCFTRALGVPFDLVGPAFFGLLPVLMVSGLPVPKHGLVPWLTIAFTVGGAVAFLVLAPL